MPNVDSPLATGTVLSTKDRLNPGDSLKPGESIQSANGYFTFIFQTDGNLVLYTSIPGRPTRVRWASGTTGRGADVCIMQGDGNFVMYNHGKAVWDSATAGNRGSYLVAQDDGNVVIYRPDGQAPWATGTVYRAPIGPVAQGSIMKPGEILNPGNQIKSDNGYFTFILQTDGNLVVYTNIPGRPTRAPWASGTVGKLSEVCIMQGDGNLVIYDPDGKALWDSATAGNGGSHLVAQDDGNVVIYKPNNGPAIWATGTVYRAPSGPVAHGSLVPAGSAMKPGEILNPGDSIKSPNELFTLIFQADGNLVLYNSQGKALWASGTAGMPGDVCIMQGDGNLVIYRWDGKALWDTATAGHPNSYLVLRDDGYLCILQEIWVRP